MLCSCSFDRAAHHIWPTAVWTINTPGPGTASLVLQVAYSEMPGTVNTSTDGRRPDCDRRSLGGAGPSLPRNHLARCLQPSPQLVLDPSHVLAPDAAAATRTHVGEGSQGCKEDVKVRGGRQGLCAVKQPMAHTQSRRPSYMSQTHPSLTGRLCNSARLA